MIAKLSLLDPHQAFVLLKNSFAIPKLTYLLRSSPAFHQADLLQEFDQALRDSMRLITNVDFSEESWIQATLPTRAGGLGIRKSSDIALPCFISSALSVGSMVEAILLPVTGLAPFNVSAEVELWKTYGEGLIEPDGEAGFRQRAWDSPRVDYIQKTLLANSDQYSKARLLASAQSESGAWISAIPVPNLGTQLNPDELRIAIALRTGAWISEIYTCKCGKKVDEYGYHQLSCHFGEGRFPRHSALNDIIWRALKSAGIPSELEPVHCEAHYYPKV